MKIVYLNGDDAGKSVDLTPSGLTIGRETDNHLQLPVGGVSRYHARIEFVEGAYMLRDLGSTNGTKLNNMLLQKIEPLKANDIITIGEQQLRVVDTEPAGKTDSKIGTSTVKIPAGVPVPEPAVPQFVFRPDSEIQPPPPPPVTDSSETATVNIAPEVAAAGNDFFAKHDADGNLFKKEGDEQMVKGKSSLRSNLIFALIILAMICGGVVLFYVMKDKLPKQKKPVETNSSQDVVESDEFFFYYEVLNADPQTLKLTRKKVYCRLVDGEYRMDMFYTDISSDDSPVEVQKVAYLEESTIKRYQDHNDIQKYARMDDVVETPDTGNELKWTRLAICANGKIHDSTVLGSSKDATFRRAEDVVNRLIRQTKPGKLMMSADELRTLAESSFRKANDYYKTRENNPVDNSNALVCYLDGLEFYRALTRHTVQDEKNQQIANERASELSAKLKKLYDDAVSNADIAYSRKNYVLAKNLCANAKKYFISQSDEYRTLSQMESECAAKIRMQQKGKK